MSILITFIKKKRFEDESILFSLIKDNPAFGEIGVGAPSRRNVTKGPVEKNLKLVEHIVE